MANTRVSLVPTSPTALRMEGGPLMGSDRLVTTVTGQQADANSANDTLVKKLVVN